MFADSPAFATVKKNAYGVLQRDLDGDGLADHFIAEKSELGWTAAFYQHRRDEKGDQWHRACVSAPVEGEEITDFRWTEMDDGPLLLLVANDENPDEIVQSLLLMDPAQACASRFSDRMVLVRPDGEVIAPGPVPGGIVWVDGKLHLNDQPHSILLDAGDHRVALLRSVRARRISGTTTMPSVEETTAKFLLQHELDVSWHADTQDDTQEAGDNTGSHDHDENTGDENTGATGAANVETKDAVVDTAQSLPELVDDSDVTGFVLRAGETGQLRIEAAGKMVALVIHHGCRDQMRPLQLRRPPTAAWNSDKPRPVEGFVRAWRQTEAPNVHRYLLALDEPVDSVTLEVGPQTDERCLRQVRGYGFR